jgi:O-antigen/teichoic acid export membrane protein
LRTKLGRDVLWNLASLAVVAVCGLALNVVIGLYYDAGVLGIFNQVLSLYLVFSQFGMLGLYSSTLNFVASHQEDRPTCASIFQAGILLTIVVSALCALIFWTGRPWAARWLSPGVAEGMAWSTPGLFFFSINKVFLAALNGLRRMRLYAIMQALRYLLLVGGLLLAPILDWPGPALAVVLSLAEGTLFLLLLPCLRGYLGWGGLAGMRPWLGRHLEFGVKSLASGVLLELNTRVDVLVLGLLTNDRLVGIFSFASMLAEGFFQILVVLRVNFDPILAQLASQGRLAELEAFARRARLAGWGIMLGVGLVSVLAYPHLVALLTNKPEFQESTVIFAILMAGIVLASGHMPLRNIIMQAGFPGYQSLHIAAVVVANALGNLAFIPLWGGEGAALGTACSLAVAVWLLKLMTRRLVGVRM